MDVAMISHLSMVFGLFIVIILHFHMIERRKMRGYTYKNGLTPHFAIIMMLSDDGTVAFTQHVV